MAVLCVFLIDFLVNLSADQEYWISFYFWTDIFNSVLLIFDFSAIRQGIFSGDSDPQR